MKRLIYKIFQTICLAAILGLTSWSCTEDDSRTGNTDSHNPAYATLRVVVPGMELPDTRALSEADENALSTVDVLVFRVTSGGQETFYYRTHGTDISNSGAIRTFKVALRTSDDGSDRHRFVVFSNLRGELDAVVGSFTQTTTKEDALAAVKFAATEKWNTTSSANFRPLPMWGQSGGTHVVGSTLQPSNIGTIHLLRAVARIDVGINFSGDIPQGLGTKFKLSDVLVYNPMEAGAAAPASANYNSATKTVTAPSVPTDAVRSATPLTYTHMPADFGMVREIYIAESSNAGLANDKTTCLLLGGYYDGSTTQTWYRIDFYQRTAAPDAPHTRLNILRSHRYKVNITAVDGPGYGTQEEALNSTPVNMQTDIIVWNEGAMDDIVFDGQYYLKVNMDSLHMFSEGREQAIRVKTDHPGGWSIETSSKPGWITCNPQTGTMNTGTEIKFTAEAFTITPPALDYRRDYVTIKAGKLKKRILVYQTTEPELSIDVTPSTLTFRKSGSNPKTITVTTYPTDVGRAFTSIGAIPWTAAGTSTGLPAGGLTQTTYGIRPPVNTGSDVLNSIVTVYVERGGRVGSRQVTVRQLATDLLFAYQTSNPYPAAGGNDLTFKVTSESDWNIQSVLPTGIVSVSNEQHTPATDGIVKFNLTPNPTFAQRSVALSVASPHPDFVSQDITITQNHAAPAISLSQAGHDFGTTMTPWQVSITSNCDWKYAESATGSQLIAAGDKPQNTVVATGAAPLTAQTTALRFTPYTWPKDGNTPAAGTRVAATYIFKTTNQAPAAEQAVSLTLQSTVPGYFDAYSNGIPNTLTRQDATNLFVSANTNMGFTLRSSLGQTGTVVASNYGRKQTPGFRIPANDGWTSRQVTFTTVTNTGNVDSKTVTQTGYHVRDVTTTMPNEISGDAQTYTINADGDYPFLNWQLRLNGTVVLQGQINGRSKRADFTVPATHAHGFHPLEIIVTRPDGALVRSFQSMQKHPWDYISPDGRLVWYKGTWDDDGNAVLPPPYGMKRLETFCYNLVHDGYTDWKMPDNRLIDLGPDDDSYLRPEIARKFPRKNPKNWAVIAKRWKWLPLHYDAEVAIYTTGGGAWHKKDALMYKARHNGLIDEPATVTNPSASAPLEAAWRTAPYKCVREVR